MNALADHSHLRGWTPISFAAEPEPRLEWADLRAHHFERPFFSQTLADWRNNRPSPTEWTDLAALHTLDSTPSLDPSLIIVHAARCGSTLLAQLMGALDGAMIVSEPGVLGGFLSSETNGSADSSAIQILRKIVRALGRVRFGDEKHYILKLSSSLTRFLPMFRHAFPGVPMVWLQRRPAEIIESELRKPGGWLGFDPSCGEELPRLVLHKLTVVFLAAKAHVNDDMLVLDYRDLPDAAWSKVAPFMGVVPTKDDLARMQAVTGYHAHTGKPFEARERQPLPDWVQAAVRQTLNPLYEALDRRRSRVGA